MKRTYLSIFTFLILFFCSCCPKYFNTINQYSKDNKKDGVWITYVDSTKNYSISNFKNGVLHGNFTEYFENGIVSIKGTYFNGKKDKKWLYFTQDGKVLTWQKFKKGVFIKMVRGEIPF
jgi:antitoxin component YwqK of YwqJK toxin-antitoxin module